MKRLFYSILSISLLLISCNSGTKNVQNNEKALIEAEVPESTDANNTNGGIPIKINSNEFIEKVHDFKSTTTWKYKGTLPCIVDFYADWCRPCKMMDPLLEKLAKEYDGKIIIYKINIDENKDIAQAFEINSIPFFLFCPVDGQAQATMGMMSEEQTRQAIKDVLKK
ncbi:MAG: thioredoxin domain-containing protein [Bacteroidales bacterium]|nr:thioredoxin domain-containing protein [Bacteroidales bacterium]MDD2688301.1 thioredoxin domain-containing protein [Bacteroidales bacterium]MDD4044375.1 thioredoxin domain-containing protein [Bacteroidales bacterium]MDD4580870.1 thioredoxin domain-containing protein [Bacteroidales bacterium]